MALASSFTRPTKATSPSPMQAVHSSYSVCVSGPGRTPSSAASASRSRSYQWIAVWRLPEFSAARMSSR